MGATFWFHEISDAAAFAIYHAPGRVPNDAWDRRERTRVPRVAHGVSP